VRTQIAQELQERNKPILVFDVCIGQEAASILRANPADKVACTAMPKLPEDIIGGDAAGLGQFLSEVTIET